MLWGENIDVDGGKSILSTGLQHSEATMANDWIDIHGHFTPPTSPEDREKKWHAMRDASFMVPEPYEWTPDSTLTYLDKAGIAMQMLEQPAQAAWCPERLQ